MNHNILLISALIIFAFIILRVYFLFLLHEEEKPPEELTLDETIKRAQQLYNNGMHLELQRFLKKELTKKYQSLELRKLLIRSYLDIGNTNLAALHLEAVLKVDPSDMESREELGRIYLEDGNKRKALAVYETIYAYNPTDIVAIKNLAQLYRDISSAEKAIKKGMRDAVTFGPFLIVNGKPAQVKGNGGWGYANRTAIAQRKDGIVLFLVIDGRGANGSDGISIADMITLFEKYGAYNAANLDGGGSSVLTIEGELINSPRGFGYTGERYLPNAWILK